MNRRLIHDPRTEEYPIDATPPTATPDHGVLVEVMQRRSEQAKRLPGWHSAAWAYAHDVPRLLSWLEAAEAERDRLTAELEELRERARLVCEDAQMIDDMVGLGFTVPGFLLQRLDDLLPAREEAAVLGELSG